MFDDQTNNQVAPPANLPTEPVDMFAGVDAPDVNSAPQPPNALDVGLLKKKISTSPEPSATSTSAPVAVKPSLPSPASIPPVAPTAPSSSLPAAYTMREPVLGKIILFVVFGVILAGMGYGGWWAYNNFIKNKPTGITDNTTQVQTDEVKETSTQVQNNIIENATTSDNTNISAEMNNDKILLGEPIDTDKDGLDDIREKELGTNQNLADTDSDGLNDGEEVIIFKTNPLNPDTDGDGYVDGKEVRNGYSPLGPGKLNILPTDLATTTVANTTTTTTTTNK